MCDPVTIGLILSAAGGGASAVNTNQALRRQDKQAAEGIRRQGRIQSGASGRIDEQITDIAGSTGEGERAKSLEGFLNTLRASQESTEGALDPIAAANPRFAERVTGGKARIAERGTAEAGRLSRIDAPGFQRLAEAARVGRTGSDVREFGRQSTVEDFLTQLRVAGERPNEFVEALAGIAKGAGSALTLGAGSGIGVPDLAKLFSKGTLIDAPSTAARVFGTVV